MDIAPWAPVALDLAVVLVVLGNTARGWHSGLLAGGLGLVGQVGGAIVGVWAAPRVLALLPTGSLGPLAQAGILVLVVLAAAAVGSAVLGWVGLRLRSHHVEVIHAMDRSLGAVGAAVVSALVLAVLASAVKPVAPASWARTIDGSRTLTALGAVMPDELTRAASRLTAILDAAGFPRVFSGLTPEPLLPVEAPDAAATRTAAVQAASDSVVRVSSLGCGATQVGSGWVSSPGRVVTNAHVVAGGAEVSVEVAGTGSSLPATVVAFDPDLDLAVLRVDGLRAEPLPRAGALPDQSDVVVAGFPGGGPFEVSAGRVRGTIDAAGDDIYGGQGVTRQVYALWATVEQGNSGGPLLTPEGGVAGTVFARSMVDPFTAYALTDAQTAPVIEAAAGATAAVSTQECVRR